MRTKSGECTVDDDMNQPSPTVRIIAVPPGEAPFWVRQEWVGLELPLTRHSARRKLLAFGVHSMPRSWWAQWFAVLLGRAQTIDGYAIETAPAIEILDRACPDAAAWWREHMPHRIGPLRYFVFHAHVCQVIGA
jgi:hypothetical protein